jgi:predicted MFS family arabinose efflux permease
MGARAPTTLARVREVFSGTGFRKFFLARLVSQAGDGIFQLSAAAVLLFEHPGTNPTIALLGVTVVTLIPFSVVGPFAGVFIDRWDRHKIIVWVPVVRALTALTLPLAALAGKHAVAFYLVVLFVLSVNRFFLSTMSAILPGLVPDDDLIVANSAASTGGAVANVVGQGIGSALSAVLGGTTASVFGAMLFGASALATKDVPLARAHARAARGSISAQLARVASDMREGMRAIASDRRVVYALSAVGMVQVLVGAMIAVLTYYFIHVLRLKVGSATAILAVLALGIGAGVLLVPFVSRRVKRHDALIPASFAVGALANAVAAAALGRATLLVGAMLAGVSYAFAKIPVDTIVQHEMADVVRGRAFAVYDMLFNAARVAGVAIVALAYSNGAGTRAIVAAIAAAYVACAAAFGVWERGGPMFRRKRTTTAPELRPGEIVQVRAYAGGRADEEPRAIVIGGHEVPVDRVEWRAVVEEPSGRRARVFVVFAAGARVRLALYEDATGWEVERVLQSDLSEMGQK